MLKKKVRGECRYKKLPVDPVKPTPVDPVSPVKPESVYPKKMDKPVLT